MALSHVHVGGIELQPLVDAVGELDELSELYPDVAPGDWEPFRERYPELFNGTRWRAPCTCYLVRSGGTTILVDTGVAPPGLWDWTAVEEGLLPEALAELANAPEDFDEQGSVSCFVSDKPAPGAPATVVRRGADGADAELVLQNLECTIFTDSPTGEEKIDRLEAAFDELQSAIRP